MPAGRPTPRKTVLMAVVALVAIAVSAAVWRWRATAQASVEYVTAPVSRGVVAPAVTTSGTVNPETTIQVGTYVSGVIQSISCDFNTRVQVGQLCATIDPRPYQVTVEQASAALATARAQLVKDRASLAYAKQIYERATGLLARGIVSQETLDTAKNAYEQAVSQIALDEATIEQHAAQLKAAQINLGYTRIVSPVNGTVVSRNVTQGQTVAASFQTPTLFVIATDLTRMQVDTNVSESDIGRIAPGQKAVFTVESYPDRQFAATVAQVRQAPQSVQNVVTYDVVVSVPNVELMLKPGMTAAVRIITAQTGDVLRVPEQSLRYAPGGQARPAPGQAAAGKAAGRERMVWVLSEGKPRGVPVSVGIIDENYAQITNGDLREGDQVIVTERTGGAAAPASGSATLRAPRL